MRAKSLCLFFILITFGNASFAGDTTSFSLTSHVYTQFVDSPVIASRVTGTLIEANYSQHLSETIESLIQAGARIEGGSSRALYNDEFAPRQTPVLREASVSWEFLHKCKLRAGALDQNFLDSPLIVKDQSFPGAYEGCFIGNERWKITADLEQTYAADTQFTHPTGRSLQSDSKFFIERVSAEFKIPEKLSLKLLASHFLFSGLSSLVAYQSQFMGNTSSGLDDKNADFRYAYQAYELGGSAEWKTASSETKAKLNAIRNAAAPKGANAAYDANLRSAWRLSEKLGLAPAIRYFYAESDASPAFFSDPSIAHANSRGLGFQLSLLLPKSHAEVALNYVLARPLATTLYQPGAESWIFAVLRINYEIL